MLEKVNLKQVLTKEEYQQEAESLKRELTRLEQSIKQAELPVIVLFEGWSAAGKGRIIGKVIQNLDPRGFKVYSTVEPSEEEKRHPFLWRFWKNIPSIGNFSIFDRSWYQEISIAKLEQKVDEATAAARTREIKLFERQLTEEGYLVIKLFLHISQKEQKKRLEELASSKNTAWRVTETDWKRNKKYDQYYKVLDEMLADTDTTYAPWHVIPCQDKRVAMLQVYRTIVHEIQTAIAQKQTIQKTVAVEAPIVVSDQFHLVDVPKLRDVDLTKTISEEQYRKHLAQLQEKLNKLHNKIYAKKIPVIICYEGWDAAGKGGNIKRVAAALDARGYEVLPIAAPDKEELNRHFLWRFWKRLPKTGHIAIFDRTWYGRVMVERIEGFCSSADWHRAYQEINEFEQELVNWGAVVVKFWIHIDQDEQLRRFEERQNTPDKQWKITDEDWRNREKWDQYEVAVDDLLQYTSTDFAPWHIIESQDKRVARLKALMTVIASIEAKLEELK